MGYLEISKPGSEPLDPEPKQRYLYRSGWRAMPRCVVQGPYGPLLVASSRGGFYPPCLGGISEVRVTSYELRTSKPDALVRLSASNGGLCPQWVSWNPHKWSIPQAPPKVESKRPNSVKAHTPQKRNRGTCKGDLHRRRSSLERSLVQFPVCGDMVGIL